MKETVKQRALRVAKELGVTIFKDSWGEFHVDAPYGYIFEPDLHYMICTDWQDIIDRIGTKLDKCEEPECDVCDAPTDMDAKRYAAYMGWELILDSETFNKEKETQYKP